MRGNQKRWWIKWVVVSCLAAAMIVASQTGSASSKYVDELTTPNNRFLIVYGDAWTQQGYANISHSNPNMTHVENEFYKIPRTGYYAFIVLGGTGGRGGEGGWAASRNPNYSSGGAGGRASGVATMTKDHVIGGAVAEGGQNGDNDNDERAVGQLSATSGNRGIGRREGGGGGGASYLMYRSANGAWAVGNQFACAGGGGGGGGNRRPGQQNAVSYWALKGGNGGVIDGAGSGSGADGAYGNSSATCGKGGVYNAMGSNTGGGAAGTCGHSGTGYAGGWQYGGNAKANSSGGGGGSGFPGGGGATQGCNENFAGNGGGGGASVVQSNATGLGAIATTPATILSYMNTKANGLRTEGGMGDGDRGLSGSAVIAFVGYSTPDLLN
ncbi:MAG: hypothetical protein LBG83_07690 [Oscillospiraceae bacterium]|jgi:hypothetical protein|nr:hypothetical protein [Oscillospiraceae bacterium]